MPYQPTILDHPTLPGAALVSTPDGGQLTIDRSRLPQLGLAQAGATAQSMTPVEPMTRNQPSNQGEFATKWTNEPVVEPSVMQDVQPKMTSADPPAARPQPQHLGHGRYQMPDGRVMTQQAGTAAFDPRQYDASLAPVRTAQVTKTEGAHEFDPKAVEQYQQWEREAAETQARAKVLEAHNEAQIQGVLAQETARYAAEQAAQQRAAEESFASRQAGLEEEARAIAKREVDPNRAFSNMSIWQKLGFVLAAGMAGGANPGGRNIPIEQINSIQDADIRAQEQQIANSKGQTDNALARMTQEWGSVQAGKAATKALQWEAVKQRISTQAAQAGSRVALVNAEGMMQQITARQAKEFETMRVAAMGQVSQQQQAQMMAPRRATGGGMVEESIKGEEQRLALEGKRLDAAKKRRDFNDPTGASDDPKFLDQQAVDYTKRKEPIVDTVTNLDQFVAENHLVWDEKSKRYVKGPGFDGLPGVGRTAGIPGMSTGNLTEQGKRNSMFVQRIGESSLRRESGAVISEEEASREGGRLVGSGTEEAIIQGLSQKKIEMEKRLEVLDSGYPRVVRDRVQRNRQDARGRQIETKPVDLTE